MADEHTHNYSTNDVTYPIGVTEDGKGSIVQVEQHSFCSCGDLKIVKQGTREVR